MAKKRKAKPRLVGVPHGRGWLIGFNGGPSIVKVSPVAGEDSSVATALIAEMVNCHRECVGDSHIVGRLRRALKSLLASHELERREPDKFGRAGGEWKTEHDAQMAKFATDALKDSEP